jgi:methylenetetrahydrofolate reductase (NADPH)
MLIPELYSNSNLKPVLSFEVFPPKGDSVDVIDDVLLGLAAHRPAFISATYGAGGSNAGRQAETLEHIIRVAKVPAVAHLTCVAVTPELIDSTLDEYERIGVDNILAMRGDVPKGVNPEDSFIHYQHADQLISQIKTRGGFGIAAACYPEIHPESVSPDKEIEYLKRKAEAGAELFISQLFYNNGAFYDLKNQMVQNGITVPVTAGIMPIFEVDRVLSMTTMCGSSIPADLSRIMARHSKSPESFAEAAIEYTVGQVENLIKNGAEGIHFYTMNKADLITKILARVTL